MVRLFKFLVIIICVLSIPTNLYAPWIWNPDTGWMNEKDIAKESPKSQWEYAQAFELEKNYSRAIRAYEALIKEYPTSPLAAQAQEHIALCNENNGKLYRAYEAYQILIDTYPQHINFETILKRQCEIGIAFIKGKRRKLWKIPFVPAVDKGIEILEKVIENAPYSAIAPQAQYMIGLGYKKIKKYAKSATAFEKCYTEYSDSSYAEKALYQSAFSLYRQSKGSAYDQAATNKALILLNLFEQKFPESKYLEKITPLRNELEIRKAEGLYNIAVFYEKSKHYKSAVIYYKKIIRKFPESSWAQQSAKRVAELKPKIKK